MSESSVNQSTWQRLRNAHVLRVLGVYVTVSFGMLQAVDLLSNHLGLPDWVFPTSLVLLVIGLAVILITVSVQHAWQHRQVSVRAARLFTWRNVVLGGVGAFGLLGFAAFT